jgi:hypothetical protein
LLVAGAAVLVLYTLRSAQGVPPIPGLGPHAFSSSNEQSVSLPTLSRLQICNKVGNVNISVDTSGANTIKVSAKKTVQATSDQEAAQKFKQMFVEIQPPDTLQNALACRKSSATPTPTGSQSDTQQTAQSLLVNVTIPTSDTIVPNTAYVVDLTISVPQTSLPKDGPTMYLDLEAPLGNITIDGLSGSLHIRGGTGDVSVKHAVLTDGSDIETGHGNVTFNGLLAVPQSTPARFMLRCERGDIDVTLPADLNLLLDSNTNAGTIKSDFPFKVDNKSGKDPVSYHGPLNPDTTARPGTLVLDVSLGNVTIHKQQATT